ncbi:DNA-directed RNA polymerase [Coelomomyces lativittatus]|nr:DNA-directed RNA polymerase [Coelomomyces lativittatus]
MDLDSLTQFKLSSYLASKVLGSIKHLLNRAQELQHWLNTVAHIIAHSVPPDVTSNPTPFRNCVAWTTPLGLTCTQPYRREKTCQVETALQCISLFDPTTCAPINSQKQKTAFPPNFFSFTRFNAYDDVNHRMLSIRFDLCCCT